MKKSVYLDLELHQKLEEFHSKANLNCWIHQKNEEALKQQLNLKYIQVISYES
jgi:hypothetical protein